MGRLKLECRVETCDKIPDFGVNFDMSVLDACITGELTVWLDEERFNTPKAELIGFSCNLLTAAWDLISFGSDGEEKLVWIAEDHPNLRIRLDNENFVLSIGGSPDFEVSTTCRILETLHVIGKFHKNMTERLLLENPLLIEFPVFRYVYPGAGYFFAETFGFD
jgi:hypothetical protein